MEYSRPTDSQHPGSVTTSSVYPWKPQLTQKNARMSMNIISSNSPRANFEYIHCVAELIGSGYQQRIAVDFHIGAKKIAKPAILCMSQPELVDPAPIA